MKIEYGKKKILRISSGIIIVLFIAIIVSINNNEITKVVSSTGLDNTKIGWGIKRNDNHAQPDLGSKNLQLINEYNGIAMGNSEKKYVYLTFDEGYEAGYTESILNTLKENDVKAVFFITGHYLNTAEDLVQRMIDEGHIVGNHTSKHYSMPDLSDEDIKEEVTKLQTALYEKTGYEMKYIRPPKGEYSERTLAITNNLGYTTVMWSFAYDDWEESKQGRTEYAKEKIINNVHPGCVMLLHATSKDNAEVLDEVIKEIKNMGYEFKCIDEFEK
jgi:peptidoglycan-N-acetylmuramic acid deacetylase